MSSYFCPRCHNKGPVLLRANQVCQGCRSAQVWAQFGVNNRVIVVPSEVEREPASEAVESPPVRGGRVTQVLLVLSLGLMMVVLVLLVNFFKTPPNGLSVEQLLSRYNLLATVAVILGCLTVLTSVPIFYYDRKKSHRRRLARLALLSVVGLAIAAFLTSFYCWSRTERVWALPLVPPAAGDSPFSRVQSATAVIYALNTRRDRYRAARGAGVIIASKSDRVWILTVPNSVDDSWRDLLQADTVWVSFSDGRSALGRVRWSEQPTNLAIIQVNAAAPASEVQVHPIAEGVIPGEEVFAVPNPIYAGWTIEPGTILNRQGLRTDTGWNCLVNVDVNPRFEDVGGGLYDRSGRLLALKAGFDKHRSTAQFVIISSDVMRRIMAMKEAEEF